MRTITKKGLEELARTMAVIPEKEQEGYVGKDGYTEYFSSEKELHDYLYWWSNNMHTEIAFVQFSDGTYATYLDEKNTHISSYITLKDHHDGTYSFEDKQIDLRGHVHPAGTNPDPSEADKKSANQTSSIPCYVFANGKYELVN